MKGKEDKSTQKATKSKGFCEKLQEILEHLCLKCKGQNCSQPKEFCSQPNAQLQLHLTSSSPTQLQSCKKIYGNCRSSIACRIKLGKKKATYTYLNFTQMTCGSSTVSSEERHHKRNSAKSSGELFHSAPKHACHISNSLTANMPSWTPAYFLQSRRGGKATKFILALKLMSKIAWWANEIIAALKNEQQDSWKLWHFPFSYHTGSLPNQWGNMKIKRGKNIGGKNIQVWHQRGNHLNTKTEHIASIRIQCIKSSKGIISVLIYLDAYTLG